jgi:hypothetical protein
MIVNVNAILLVRKKKRKKNNKLVVTTSKEITKVFFIGNNLKTSKK